MTVLELEVEIHNLVNHLETASENGFAICYENDFETGLEMNSKILVALD